MSEASRTRRSVAVIVLIGFTASACAISPGVEGPTPYPTYTPIQDDFVTATPIPTRDLTTSQEGSPFAIQVAEGYQIQHLLQPEVLMPSDLAVGPEGDLFVTEFEQQRILRITVDGVVSTYQEGGLIGNALAADDQGILYVEAGADIIKILPTGERQLFAADVEHHCDLAVGPSNELYTTAGTDLIRFEHDGTPIVLSSEILGCGDIAVAPNGEAYVTYWPTGELLKVGLDGSVSTLSSAFAFDAFNIAFDDQGRLYQNQMGFTEISLLDGSFGEALFREYTSALVSRPFKFDSAGNALFVGPTTHTVVRAAMDGSHIECLVEGLANSDALAVGPSGDLYMGPSDCFPIEPGKITRVSTSGEMSIFVTNLDYVKDIVFDPQGNAYVSDLYGGPGHLLRITPDGTASEILSREGMELHSLAYDTNTDTIWAFEHLSAEVLRISLDGSIEVLPLDFGDRVNMIDMDFDPQGNLIALVVYEDGLAYGPVHRSLFRIAPDLHVELITHIDTEMAGTVDDMAVSPTGEIFVAGPERHPIFRILRITPEGEVSVFASNVPYDTLSIDVGIDGAVYFTCSAGLFKITPVP